VNCIGGLIWRFLQGERVRSQQFTLVCRVRAELSACVQMSGRSTFILKIWLQQILKIGWLNCALCDVAVNSLAEQNMDFSSLNAREVNKLSEGINMTYFLHLGRFRL